MNTCFHPDPLCLTLNLHLHDPCLLVCFQVATRPWIPYTAKDDSALFFILSPPPGTRIRDRNQQLHEAGFPAFDYVVFVLQDCR